MTLSVSVLWHKVEWKYHSLLSNSLSDLMACGPADSPQLHLCCTKVHPCRRLTASRVPGQPLSGSCGSPSNQSSQSHHPTGSTSLCRSPTGDHRRSDTAGPGGGAHWRLVSFYWGSGICSPRCRGSTKAVFRLGKIIRNLKTQDRMSQ